MAVKILWTANDYYDCLRGVQMQQKSGIISLSKLKLNAISKKDNYTLDADDTINILSYLVTDQFHIIYVVRTANKNDR